MIKIPKDMLIEKIKEKAGLSDKEIQSKIKDKLDQLSGLISEEGALHFIANELGVKVFDEDGKLQIKNVMPGMKSVQLTAKVIRVYEVREFATENRKGKVGSFLIGDETGVIRVTAWNDKADLLAKLKEHDVVAIENGYAKENRGRMEVHMGDKTTVSINPDGAPEIEVKEKERKSIKDLTASETNAEVMGTIVQVFDPRFFTVDPDSGRKVVERDGKYYLGDQVIATPGYSYVTNLVLDDGTENIRVVLWKSQTQKLFNMTDDQILAKREGSFEDIKTEMLGKIVKFVGRTNKNEMFDRIEYIPNLVIRDPDPQEELERMQKEQPVTAAAEPVSAEPVAVSEPEPVVEQPPVAPVKESRPIPVEDQVLPKQEELATEDVEEPVVEKADKVTEEVVETVETVETVESVSVEVNEPVLTTTDEVKVESTTETVEEPVLSNQPAETAEPVEKIEPVEELKLEEVAPESVEVKKEESTELEDIEDITDLDSL